MYSNRVHASSVHISSDCVDDDSRFHRKNSWKSVGLNDTRHIRMANECIYPTGGGDTWVGVDPLPPNEAIKMFRIAISKMIAIVA